MHCTVFDPARRPDDDRLDRRSVLIGAALLAARATALPALAQDGTTEFTPPASSTIRNNVSSFRMLVWRGHFANTNGGAVLIDITSRALHQWSEDQSIYRPHTTSVPLSESLARLGATTVTGKVVKLSCRLTPSMKKRNPEWPDVVEGGWPDNPPGTRALYPSWTFHRIHGIHDTRKIGRKSLNGCIDLHNEHSEELFEMACVGTQVLLI